MRMQHILVEGYCDKDKPSIKYPCNKNDKKMGIYCLGCDLFSYTIAPNEIAYSNEESVIESKYDFISLDVDIDDDRDEKRYEKIALWHNICKAKIAEAYDEYLNKLKEVEQNHL